MEHAPFPGHLPRTNTAGTYVGRVGIGSGNGLFAGRQDLVSSDARYEMWGLPQALHTIWPRPIGIWVAPQLVPRSPFTFSTRCARAPAAGGTDGWHETLWARERRVKEAIPWERPGG